MAESIFDALSGGESEDAASTAPASGPHPFAAALAADMTRHDPEVAAETATFLRRQSALLRTQAPDAANAAYAQALLNEEASDLPAAAKSWDDFAAAYADPVVAPGNREYMCWAAPTYQRTGQPAKADAALAAPMKAVGVSTFVDCYRFRGDVLDLRGDWHGAQVWYAKAVKLGPDIPSG